MRSTAQLCLKLGQDSGDIIIIITSCLPPSFTHHLFVRAFLLLSSDVHLSLQKWTIIESQTYVADTKLDLLPPPEIAALETLLVNLHQYRVNIDVAIIIRLQQQIKVGVSHRPAREGICKLN